VIGRSVLVLQTRIAATPRATPVRSMVMNFTR
jgi:hypothetical protein